MKDLKKILFISALVLFSSCQEISTDLEVANTENPNDEILTTNPVALEAAAATIINNWFLTIHSFNGPGAAFATMADVSTCSWGNFGMRDTSSEPRVAFNNTPSYSNDVTNSYFNSLHSILSDSNTLAAAVASGTSFSDVNLIDAISKFGQALSIGYLALVFDQVWISDENGVVEGQGVNGASTYQEAMTFALAKLDQAITIAKNNNVSFDSYIPGGNGVNEMLVPFMNSMGARMLVGNVRNSAEKNALDWDRVLGYANNGLTSDFEILMDDINWYDLIPKTYLVYPGWGRVDMRIVNMMDSTIPSYWGDGVTTIAESEYGDNVDKRLSTDYQYLPSNSFRPERGYYHFSNYRYSRYDEYITEWTIPVVEFSASENDMYKAEAYAHKNSLNLAANIINRGTRVTRGGLSSVSENIQEIKDAIHHERMVEFAFTSMGLSFFEMRKENLLQSGTLLHFPVPGKALEAIPTDNYTFGGTDGVAGQDYSNGGWR